MTFLAPGEDGSCVSRYGDYRNFEAVVEKAKMACFNSGHRLEDHFVDITEMVAIGSKVGQHVIAVCGDAPSRAVVRSPARGARR